MREEREETEKECARHERNKEINKTLVDSCYSNLVLVLGYCSNLLKVFGPIWSPSLSNVVLCLNIRIGGSHAEIFVWHVSLN